MFLKDRRGWKPFVRLIDDAELCSTFKNDPSITSLTNDIFDKFHDLRPRETDMLECRLTHARFLDLIHDPFFKKTLAELAPVGIVAQQVYVFPTFNSMTRLRKETYVYIQVRAVPGQALPSSQYDRMQLEQEHFKVIAQFVSERAWYISEYFYSKISKLNIKICYDDDIPDVLLGEVYCKACSLFFPHLEPLVLFFHSVMSEDSVGGPYGRTTSFDEKWLPQYKTAMLVIFFLQHCELIPLIMRDTDVFVPTNVTWEKLIDWDEGRQRFFTDQYMFEGRKWASRSIYAKAPLGKLFFLMLVFYTKSIHFGEGRIIIDKGTHPPLMEQEQNCLVIDSVLLRRTSDDFPRKMVYFVIMKAMHSYLCGCRDAGSVGDDLSSIRSQLIEVRRAEEAGRPLPKIPQ
ncbi:hypothetical protein GCK72_006498 [Caenorhabditis remanei]|uniref:Uncharacterized protein n=1 Tax=Caenorhabditis remanei TaxID=31234 RepID=A0A6A5HHI7_CAERE|nr:hypothetical protein GCK72_006498 [Caenorhabditis remanei]KAF1766541.1 hypothetical protein GCK72_006498 [Caenorhabditis remanei]